MAQTHYSKLVAKLDVQTTAPSEPVAGQTYYNPSDGKIYIYNGSAWKSKLLTTTTSTSTSTTSTSTSTSTTSTSSSTTTTSTSTTSTSSSTTTTSTSTTTTI